MISSDSRPEEASELRRSLEFRLCLLATAPTFVDDAAFLVWAAFFIPPISLPIVDFVPASPWPASFFCRTRALRAGVMAFNDAFCFVPGLLQPGRVLDRHLVHRNRRLLDVRQLLPRPSLDAALHLLGVPPPTRGPCRPVSSGESGRCGPASSPSRPPSASSPAAFFNPAASLTATLCTGTAAFLTCDSSFPTPPLAPLVTFLASPSADERPLPAGPFWRTRALRTPALAGGRRVDRLLAQGANPGRASCGPAG